MTIPPIISVLTERIIYVTRLQAICGDYRRAFPGDHSAIRRKEMLSTFVSFTKVDLSTPDKNNHEVKGFNKTLLVALSAADTNKWSTLLEKRDQTPKLESTNVDYERTGPILQRQRRLTDSQALTLGDRYREGTTVYQLAKEFGISRNTVSERLKKAGITMRQQSPKSELIDEMVGLYESGLSLAEVGNRVGTSPGTVHRYIRIRGVQMRDSHGRKR